MSHRKRSRSLSKQEEPERLAYAFSRSTVASTLHPDRNEDRLIADRQNGLAAVLDGVGGSVAGEVASQIASQVLRRGWRRALQGQNRIQSAAPLALVAPEDLQATLRLLVEEAHERIRGAGRPLDAGSASRTGTEDQATTVALAVFLPHAREQGCTMGYAWVGDSRIYLLREGLTLTCLTQDDGYLRQLVQAQLLTEQDALRIDQAISLESLSLSEQVHFQHRNGITQALGDPHPPVIHVGQTSLGALDRVLLCTDGIHDNLTDREIETVVQGNSRSSVARALVEQAQQRALQSTSTSMRAKPDDMSAVLVTLS